MNFVNEKNQNQRVGYAIIKPKKQAQGVKLKTESEIQPVEVQSIVLSENAVEVETKPSELEIENIAVAEQKEAKPVKEPKGRKKAPGKKQKQESEPQSESPDVVLKAENEVQEVDTEISTIETQHEVLQEKVKEPKSKKPRARSTKLKAPR
jgi:hypothetical protein